MFYKIVTETSTTKLPSDLAPGTKILSGAGKPWPMFSGVRRVTDTVVEGVRQGIKDVCIVAPMQWGKTSVVQAISEKLPECRIVYFCSYDRNSFKAQMKADAAGIENLKIIFPKDYKKYSPQQNDVIIFDECHYGDKVEQGFDVHVKKRAHTDATFIWLSATPFAALARPETGRTLTVYPTREECDGYRGVAEWIQEGTVCSNYSLPLLLREMLPGQYGIIRQRNSRELRKLKKTLEGAGITVVVFNQKNPIDNIFEWTRQTFLNPTVLLVQGNLVQGDRIDNTNLAFTYECNLSVAANANVDTVVQSLIGRSCGWKAKTTCRHVTNLDACLEYVKAWERLWDGNKFVETLPLHLAWSSTVSAQDKEPRVEALAQVDYFPNGYSDLPETVRAQLRWGMVQGRNVSKRGTSLSTFKADNDGRTADLVMTKSYFGKGETSEANLDEIKLALSAFKEGRHYQRFQTFARQGTTLEAVQRIRYGVFFINTNELEPFGVAQNSCFLLTRIDGETRVTEAGVTLRPASIHKEQVYE